MPGQVANRARLALKSARRLQLFIIGPAGFQVGQVYNRALTYTYIYIYYTHMYIEDMHTREVSKCTVAFEQNIFS